MNNIALLLDKSLLQNPVSGRYSLHELLRTYALNKLREMEDGAALECQIRREHAVHFLTHVAQIAPEFWGSNPKKAVANIKQRLGNVTQTRRPGPKASWANCKPSNFFNLDKHPIPGQRKGA
jgi:hypothetical protein